MVVIVIETTLEEEGPAKEIATYGGTDAKVPYGLGSILLREPWAFST